MTGSGKAKVTLPTDERILIVRVFDAPRRLVWRAWTEPDLIKRWWGGERGEVVSAEIDLRVGGAWRCVMMTDGGVEVAFRGEYREVVPDERVVSTEVYEGVPEAEALNTVTFAEAGGRTTVTVLVQHKSKEARDAHIASGMEAGMQEALDSLERVAISLRRARVGERMSLEASSGGGTVMADENSEARSYGRSAGPAPDVRALDRLVGKWELSGEVQGTTTFEWMEGGFFLLQRVDLEQHGQKVKGIEVIGHLRPFGEAPSEEIWSRFYDSAGNTLDYVYELEGDTLTIWGGEKGSPAYSRGTFSDDGDTCSGAWHYPGGGGYEWTMTRAE